MIIPACLMFTALTALTALIAPAPGLEPDAQIDREEACRLESVRLRELEPTIYYMRERMLDEILSAADAPEGHWARTWAGSYSVGSGHMGGTSMYLTPSGVLMYMETGCLGLYDANTGRVTGTFDLDADGEPDGLTAEWDPRPMGGEDMDSDRLYFVEWGAEVRGDHRRYLIPEGSMLTFVNDFNDGGRRRDDPSAPCLRAPDARPMRALNAVAPLGLPRLPERWADLLIPERLTARVIEVADLRYCTYDDIDTVGRCRVTLDQGADDGVFVGMHVWVTRSLGGDGFFVLDVISADATTCVADVRAFGETEDDTPVPDPGDEITLAAGFDQPHTRWIEED